MRRGGICRGWGQLGMLLVAAAAVHTCSLAAAQQHPQPPPPQPQQQAQPQPPGAGPAQHAAEHPLHPPAMRIPRIIHTYFMNGEEARRGQAAGHTCQTHAMRLANM